MHGLLLIDKPSGITSHDAVDLFRRKSRIRKVGHTGTLDPLASGLLVLCVGKATRLQSFLMGLEKTYEGEIQFGWATDTYDAEGKPVGEPREEDVEGVDFAPHIAKFVGEIEQMPPAYSAKKIEGVRAYELARRGEEVRLEPKRVTIHDFEILSVHRSVARFRLRSSAGTYVRSVAHDLGREIGSAAHLKSLRRTAIGRFVVDDALSTSRFEAMEREELFAPPHFQPIDRAQLPLERLLVDPMQEKKLLNGQSIIVKPQGGDEIAAGDLVSVVNLSDELVAIGETVEVLRAGGGPVVVKPKVVLGRG